ncbi:MAG: metal ABC transporter ATP-binding protein [Bacteroidota bacterium]
MKTPIIDLHDLSVSYHRKPVLWDIDVHFPAGKLIGIVGPNGAGKSTLLKAILGLLPIDSGYVKILGESIDKVRKKVSYMCQRKLIDWDFPISVYDLVMQGRYAYQGLFKRPSAQDKDIVMHALKQVGMLNMANRQIGELSGGQQQRIFLARALVQDALIYFMDEPFAAIDSTTEMVMLELLQEMVKKGKTIIVVHHDLAFVQAYFEWAILLNVHIVSAGPVKEIFTPELLQKTYGAQLPILHKVIHLLKTKNVPVREK